jgi:hypothetical protein
VTADVHQLDTEAEASVSAVCRVPEVPRSTACARRKRPPSRRAVETTKVGQKLALLVQRGALPADGPWRRRR